MKEINVIGTMQLLAACQKAPSVRRLVVKSSTSVYGCSPRDPALFTEDMEPRRHRRSGYAKDAVEVEGYVRGFARRRPDVAVTTLRCRELPERAGQRVGARTSPCRCCPRCWASIRGCSFSTRTTRWRHCAGASSTTTSARSTSPATACCCCARPPAGWARRRCPCPRRAARDDGLCASSGRGGRSSPGAAAVVHLRSRRRHRPAARDVRLGAGRTTAAHVRGLRCAHHISGPITANAWPRSSPPCAARLRRREEADMPDAQVIPIDGGAGVGVGAATRRPEPDPLQPEPARDGRTADHRCAGLPASPR